MNFFPNPKHYLSYAWSSVLPLIHGHTDHTAMLCPQHYYWPLLTLLLLLVASSCFYPCSAVPIPKNRSFFSRAFRWHHYLLGIVNGDYGKSDEWPMTGSLQYRQDDGDTLHYCGGTVWKMPGFRNEATLKVNFESLFYGFNLISCFFLSDTSKSIENALRTFKTDPAQKMLSFILKRRYEGILAGRRLVASHKSAFIIRPSPLGLSRFS